MDNIHGYMSLMGYTYIGDKRVVYKGDGLVMRINKDDKEYNLYEFHLYKGIDTEEIYHLRGTSEDNLVFNDYVSYDEFFKGVVDYLSDR